MQASAWRDGAGPNATYGVRVGRANRDGHFDRSWSSIEVEMDGRWETFQLTPGFWNQCTEFRDRGSPRIREWLERHFTTDWPKGSPPRFRLEVLGGGRFRLRYDV